MKKLILWIAVVLVMGLIFYLSNEPASVSRKFSIGITERLFIFIQNMMPDVQVNWDRLHHYIRKSAHFFVYMALGIFTLVALMQNRKSIYFNIVVTMLVCVLFAISDEVHQIFIPGRSGEVRDVMIDSGGALLGVFCVLVLRGVVLRVRMKRKKARV